MTASVWVRLLLVSIPSWMLALAVHAPLYLLGFPLIAWQSGATVMRDSRWYPGRQVLQFASGWMWPWQNFEDGVDGLRGGDPAQAWWAAATRERRSRARIFLWSAIRNPANALRYVPLLCPPVATPAGAVRYAGGGLDPDLEVGPGWRLVWCGLYSGLHWRTEQWAGRIGWKYRASDVSGISASDARRPRIDFAFQLKRI